MLRVDAGIPIPLPAAPDVGALADDVPSRLLPISRIEQEQSEWCWAAFLLMVLSVYRPDLLRPQCAIVSSVFTACSCGNPSSFDCNQPHRPDNILDSLHLLRDHQTGGAKPYETVRQELLANNPVGALIVNMNGLAHIVLITGFHIGNVQNPHLLYIADPGWGRQGGADYGTRLVRHVRLLNGYAESSWTETYLF